MVKRILVLDMRHRPIALALHGNRWDWFKDRGFVEIVKIFGARLPEGRKTIRAFQAPSAVANYADDPNVAIARESIVYVSDDTEALTKIRRERLGFSTIAIAPAPPELGDCAGTCCEDTADLAGLINLLDDKRRPRPHIESSASHRSEK